MGKVYMIWRWHWLICCEKGTPSAFRGLFVIHAFENGCWRTAYISSPRVSNLFVSVFGGGYTVVQALCCQQCLGRLCWVVVCGWQKLLPCTKRCRHLLFPCFPCCVKFEGKHEAINFFDLTHLDISMLCKSKALAGQVWCGDAVI